MSAVIQIVNVVTGEIGSMASEETMPIELARNIADSFAADTGHEWNVVKIEVLYSTAKKEGNA